MLMMGAAAGLVLKSPRVSTGVSERSSRLVSRCRPVPFTSERSPQPLGPRPGPQFVLAFLPIERPFGTAGR